VAFQEQENRNVYTVPVKFEVNVLD